MGAPISYSTFSKIYVWNLPILWNMDFLAVSKFVWYWFVAFSNTQLIIPTHCQKGLVTTATTSYEKEHDRIKFYKSFIIVICLFIVQCQAQQKMKVPICAQKTYKIMEVPICTQKAYRIMKIQICHTIRIKKCH